MGFQIDGPPRPIQSLQSTSNSSNSKSNNGQPAVLVAHDDAPGSPMRISPGNASPELSVDGKFSFFVF